MWERKGGYLIDGHTPACPASRFPLLLNNPQWTVQGTVLKDRYFGILG